jgi:hypothetical protein
VVKNRFGFRVPLIHTRLAGNQTLFKGSRSTYGTRIRDHAERQPFFSHPGDDVRKWTCAEFRRGVTHHRGVTSTRTRDLVSVHMPRFGAYGSAAPVNWFRWTLVDETFHVVKKAAEHEVRNVDATVEGVRTIRHAKSREARETGSAAAHYLAAASFAIALHHPARS